MEINSTQPVTQVQWKTVAVQKMTRLEELVSGEPAREVVETITPILYTKKGNQIEIGNLGKSRFVNLTT